MKFIFCLFIAFLFLLYSDLFAQGKDSTANKGRELFGVASYYGKGFNGKQTASGEIFHENGMTAACNVLPLGTWIRVTNLKNNQSVVVKVNDRIHRRMRRIVDLSKGAASKLNFIQSGITKVKVEVLVNERE